MRKISRHEIDVYGVLTRSRALWLTAAEIADEAKIAHRTARQHLHRLVDMKLVDERHVFPAFKYRIKDIRAARMLNKLLWDYELLPIRTILGATPEG